MKVLVADKFEQSGLDGLKAAGCEVSYQPDLKDDALADRDRSTRRRGAGRAVDARSPRRCSTPGACRSSCAPAPASTPSTSPPRPRGHLRLELPRQERGRGRRADLRADARARSPHRRQRRRPARRHVEQEGVLEGAGPVRPHARPARLRQHRAGSARRAARSACRCWSGAAASTARSTRAPGGERCFGDRGLDSRRAELVARADVVSVHLALTKDTRGFVDAELGARCAGRHLHQHRARRGGRLRRARERSRDEGLRVGLDVFANEPTARDRHVRRSDRALPNVYGTHHIGASTDQAQEAIAAETVRIVRTFKETGRVPNVVNLAKQTPATHMLVVRHRDKPGVLAHVFDQLRDAQLNVQETENIIFEGAEAAVARINLDGAPSIATRSMPSRRRQCRHPRSATRQAHDKPGMA